MESSHRPVVNTDACLGCGACLTTVMGKASAMCGPWSWGPGLCLCRNCEHYHRNRDWQDVPLHRPYKAMALVAVQVQPVESKAAEAVEAVKAPSPPKRRLPSKSADAAIAPRKKLLRKGRKAKAGGKTRLAPRNLGKWRKLMHALRKMLRKGKLSTFHTRQLFDWYLSNADRYNTQRRKACGNYVRHQLTGLVYAGLLDRSQGTPAQRGSDVHYTVLPDFDAQIEALLDLSDADLKQQLAKRTCAAPDAGADETSEADVVSSDKSAAADEEELRLTCRKCGHASTFSASTCTSTNNHHCTTCYIKTGSRSEAKHRNWDWPKPTLESDDDEDEDTVLMTCRKCGHASMFPDGARPTSKHHCVTCYINTGSRAKANHRKWTFGTDVIRLKCHKCSRVSTFSGSVGDTTKHHCTTCYSKTGNSAVAGHRMWTRVYPVQ